MSDTPTNDLPTWLDRRLAERGWSVKDLAAQANLSPSMVFRWRQGYLPHVANAREAATALGVPVLELLVASGQLTPEETGATVTATAAVGDLSDDELTQEITNLVREQQRRNEARKQREIPDLGPEFTRTVRDVAAVLAKTNRPLNNPEALRASFYEALTRSHDPNAAGVNLRLAHHHPEQSTDPDAAPETEGNLPPSEEEPTTLTLYTDGGRRYIAYPADHVSTPDQSYPEITETDYADHDQ